MIKTAPDYAKRDRLPRKGYLYRVLVLASFGNNIVGSSHSGSMGEHQVSHWIDMFAGPAHPGSTHGQQVGVAAGALARLHKALLSLDRAPQIKPDQDFRGRFRAPLWRRHRPHDVCRGGEEVLRYVEARPRFNRRLEEVWPELRAELKAMMIDPDELAAIMLKEAGGPRHRKRTWPAAFDVWRKAMKHARDIRNRWSFLDLADDAGLLDDFLTNDPQ
jgi:glycerol-1-phosphate dehydrogenase [NAD(P)+]